MSIWISPYSPVLNPHLRLESRWVKSCEDRDIDGNQYMRDIEKQDGYFRVPFNPFVTSQRQLTSFLKRFKIFSLNLSLNCSKIYILVQLKLVEYITLEVNE